MKKLLIGTSLSLCLGELVRGEVKLEDVDLILASTKHPDLESAIQKELKHYGPPFSPDRVREILTTIWPRVIQPRLLHARCVGHIARPAWIEAASLAEAFRVLDERDPMKVDNYEELGFVAWADILLSTRIPIPVKPEYAHVVTGHDVDPGSFDRIRHGLAKTILWSPPKAPESLPSNLEEQ